MADLPPLLDIRDDLRRARRAAGRDVNDDVAAVIERLEAVPERERGTHDSLLNEIDNELLRLEERLDGDAARSVAAARNRIGIYRDSLSGSSGHLTVLHTAVRGHDAGPGTVPPALRDEEVTVEATALNEADPRAAVPVLRFHDGDDELKSVTGAPVEFGRNDQRTVTVTAAVPSGAGRYAVAVVDADEAPTR
ncbi:DUF7553 family protein [Halostella litorea]|uniref:DUF7553 family protein n=1 Tax=Halostella litorea TaxID=2528831 RepID=UPI0010924913|nr:hypothetical protein [Halostella litorea]